MRQNNPQIGKIMLTELKSHQYKQQMTFSDSEISLNAALFSNVFFIELFSFIHLTTNNIEQREHDHNRAEEK